MPYSRGRQRFNYNRGMLFYYLNYFIETTMARLQDKPQERVRTEPVLTAEHLAETRSKEPTLHTNVQAAKGDITQYQGDAIVNAANPEFMPGGGVCGAIFSASNYEALESACATLGGCPVGFAKATPSFGLSAPHIVHAVGPIYQGGEQQEAALLASAYHESLECAHRIGARSIAFPAISTGIYGYPLEEATSIAVRTVQAYTKAHPDHFQRIDFLCFDDKTLSMYKQKLSAIEMEQERKYHVVAPLSHLASETTRRTEIKQWYIGEHAQIKSNATDNGVVIALGEQMTSIPLNPSQMATLRAILEETHPTVRVRRAQDALGEKWYLTLKGRSTGDSAPEVETVITSHTAGWMVGGATGVLEKTRHHVVNQGYTWEVDQFRGALTGLVVAELENKNYPVYPPTVLPTWVGEEVTHDVRYRNAHMASLSTSEAHALVKDSYRTSAPRWSEPQP